MGEEPRRPARVRSAACGRGVDRDHVDDLECTGRLVDLEDVVRHPVVGLVVGVDMGEDEQVVVAGVVDDASVVVVDADGSRPGILAAGVLFEVDALHARRSSGVI